MAVYYMVAVPEPLLLRAIEKLNGIQDEGSDGLGNYGWQSDELKKLISDLQSHVDGARRERKSCDA